MRYNYPKEVINTIDALKKAGFKAYVVGGCVRNILLKQEPKDWDITTSATPEEIQKLFPESIYENTFGTVGIKTKSDDPGLSILEVTTFRFEEKYSDKRHPDSIKFAKSIEEDLKRRDFSINAMAIDTKTNEIIDLFNGQEDIKNKIIKTVGDPKKRFNEDALRLMRAVRFAAQLGFSIHDDTAQAIKSTTQTLKFVSKERIRDELIKIILCKNASSGILLLESLGLLGHIIPELREGIKVSQNKHHIFTVFEHNIKSLEYAAKKDFSLDVRLAALLHDIAKPRTKRGEGPDSTYYGHQVVGARMAIKILDRLRFSKKIVERVGLLIREHMFVYDIGEVTDAGVRRLIRRTGPENIDDLFRLREADRIGSGVPKAQPYRLRHLKFMVEKVSRDPISVGMLKIDGNDIIKTLVIEPGPVVGYMLNALLGEVLEDPKLNTKKYLLNRIKELKKLSDEELKELAKKGLGSQEELEKEAEQKIKKKHYLK